MKIGLRKRWRHSDAFTAFGFWHGYWQMCRWMVTFLMCMHSGFSTGRLEQMMVTSWNYITRISCTIEGGNYKRRAQPNLGAVIWFFWYKAFGSICKPQTLYFGYLGASHGAEHNWNGLCNLFIHMHVPRPFWGTFSQCGFSCLMLAG